MPQTHTAGRPAPKPPHFPLTSTDCRCRYSPQAQALSSSLPLSCVQHTDVALPTAPPQTAAASPSTAAVVPQTASAPCNAQSCFLAAATCYSSAASLSNSISGALRRPPDALGPPSRIAATPMQPRAPLLTLAVHPHPVPPPISNPQRTTTWLKLLDRPLNTATSIKSARRYPSAPNVVAGQPHCDPINPVLQPRSPSHQKLKKRGRRKAGDTIATTAALTLLPFQQVGVQAPEEISDRI